MEYEFKQIDYEGREITVKFKAETIDEMADKIKGFLIMVGWAAETVTETFSE
jgi:hypothetical protein